VYAPFNSFLQAALTRTPLGLCPVRVRRGIARDARWTLFPWTSYWRGTHEPDVQAAMLALGGGDIRGWVCWDLGAHFGLYSVGLARRVGPAGEVAAFEPNPLSFARLERHRRMNDLSWLKLYRAAVSDQSGTAELFTYGNLASTTTHLRYEGETRASDIAPLSVQTIRLDELVKAGELRPPQFVKIDVEGHGHHAVRGMAETLAASRPIVLMAFHSRQEREETRAVLDPLGYAMTPIGADAEPSDFLFTPSRSLRSARATDR
jgi:FkbM family methyltransferase